MSLPGGDPGDPKEPLSAGGRQLFVGDRGNRRLLMRDAEGQWSIVAPSGSGDNQLGQVADAAKDPQGNLYVADRAGAEATEVRLT
ncbi:MAG TPA: hypothetical protein VGN26_06445 [Armatimonadota bacterium]|jgi:hypothetical protein